MTQADKERDPVLPPHAFRNNEDEAVYHMCTSSHLIYVPRSRFVASFVPTAVARGVGDKDYLRADDDSNPQIAS